MSRGTMSRRAKVMYLSRSLRDSCFRGPEQSVEETGLADIWLACTSYETVPDSKYIPNSPMRPMVKKSGS